MKDITRRNFLQLGIAVAVTLSGCGGGATQSAFNSTAAPLKTETTSLVFGEVKSLFPGEPNPTDLTAPGEIPPSEAPDPQTLFGPDPVFQGTLPTNRSGLDTFDHVVVIMFENRAFDHLLGYLYPGSQSPTGQPFNGIGSNLFPNPIPSYAQEADRGPIPVSKAKSLQSPLKDPAEQYGAVNVALYNAFNPESNRSTSGEPAFVAPFNVPPGGAFSPPPMDGFVRQFIYRLHTYAKIKEPTYAEYSTIMECFPPNLVPVISQLAQGFSVFDRYHCGVPSQTYTNRSFFNAAASTGLLVNSPFQNWTGFPGVSFGNTALTIFDKLSAAGRTWTIYYDADDVYPATRLIHHPRLSKYHFGSPFFKDMHEFHEDVKKGRLPDYAFVQPRFVLFTNSYHPDVGAPAVKRGEVLLNDIYQAIRQSNSTNGSNFLNTLLFVTFDEGGTCFDHVPPPTATQPYADSTGQFGFNFDRLGQRIPAIAVSAYIDPFTVVNTPLDATSMMKTIENKWGFGSINNRDAASTNLAGIFNRTTPRPRDQWPRLLVRKLSDEDLASNENQPLTDLQEAIVGSVYALQTGQNGLPPGVTTVGDALAYLRTRPLQNP